MKISPTLDAVLAYQGEATHIPVSVELLIDTETPISLYRKLSGMSAFSFLLESAEGGETFGRYSFIGFDPAATFRFGRGSGVITRGDRSTEITFIDPLDVVEHVLAEYRVAPDPHLPRFLGGAVGYIGYDAARYFEPAPVPGREAEEALVPEGYLMFTERLVIIDHLKHRLLLVDEVPLEGDRAGAYHRAMSRLDALRSRLAAPTPADEPFVIDPEGLPTSLPHSVNVTRDQFERSVEAAKDAIAAGEIFQVVLSQRFAVDVALPPFEIYRALRALNPSPYMFHLSFGDWAVVGASPEVLVRLDGEEVLLRPIAGTRPRGAQRRDDDALATELLSDEKELAEHRMLLDLGRNDVGRIALLGTVQVERPLHVERYSHVMHIVSDVRGRLAPGKTAFDVFRACFPAGTVSGAPKIRAMEIIAALEPTARGLYAGAVGYFDFSGNMDTCIAIRSLVVLRDRVYAQAGAGIVHDSKAEREYEECHNKARASLTALALAESRARSGRTRP